MGARVYRLGDTLDIPVFGRPAEDGSGRLLLAQGQRIESQRQLLILQEAGFSVRMPDRVTGPVQPVGFAAVQAAPAQAQRARSTDALSASVTTGMQIRAAVSGAVRDLIRRVDHGHTPDVHQLVSAGSELARQVAEDPTGAAAVVHLRQCDDYTIEHSADVAILMAAIGRMMGHSAEDLRLLAMAGLAHDVGKQLVPAEIVQKPGKLTPEEFREMRAHPEYGNTILSRTGDCPDPVRRVALEHHERLSGTGYPARLTGDGMHPFSRIAAVADVFDAMTADRVYRKGMPARVALQQIFADSGHHLDPVAVGALVKLVGVYPVGSRVVLSSGQRGVVADVHVEDSTRPVVRIEHDHLGRPLPAPVLLDLRDSPFAIVAAEDAAA